MKGFMIACTGFATVFNVVSLMEALERNHAGQAALFGSLAVASFMAFLMWLVD